MSPAGPIAVVVSCGLHLALLGSLWGAPPSPERTVAPTPVDVELNDGPPAPPLPPPEKHEALPPAVRRKGSAPAVPPRAPAEVTSPVVVVMGGVAGEGVPLPGGSGGTDEQGAVVTSSPPPPPPDTSVELLSLPRVPSPGVAGRVRLWVQLDETGRVLSVEVLDEPGSGLGELARKALLGATFKPPTHLGRREATAFEYVYRFQVL